MNNVVLSVLCKWNADNILEEEFVLAVIIISVRISMLLLPFQFLLRLSSEGLASLMLC